MQNLASRAHEVAEHVEARLANGLRVVCIPRPHAQQAVALLHIRVGSRFETPETNGASHFLEHMLFRGTPSLASSHEQALAFESLGGMLYASTQVDHGLLSVNFPPESLRSMLAIFAESALSPRMADIEVERGIVREEILEDLDDEGRDIDADNRVRALMFGSHPLGMTITGSLDQLERFTVPMLREHHARHYTAENCVLALAGPLDPDECIALSTAAFASMPRGERIPTAPPPLTQEKPQFVHVHNLSSQTDLRIAFRGVGYGHPLEPAVSALLRVLDDGMSTRLYGRICNEKGLAYHVSALHEAYEDDGVFDIAADVQHARAAEVSQEILNILHDLAAHGPTEAELDKLKARHGWEIRAMHDEVESLAGFYGLSLLCGTEKTPLERHEKILALSRDDIREAAAHIFRPERLNMAAIGSLRASQKRALERVLKSF